MQDTKMHNNLLLPLGLDVPLTPRLLRPPHPNVILEPMVDLPIDTVLPLSAPYNYLRTRNLVLSGKNLPKSYLLSADSKTTPTAFRVGSVGNPGREGVYLEEKTQEWRERFYKPEIKG